MSRKATPAERAEFEAFARAALGKPKPTPKPTVTKQDAAQKASVKRIFAQETKS